MPVFEGSCRGPECAKAHVILTLSGVGLNPKGAPTALCPVCAQEITLIPIGTLIKVQGPRRRG